MTIERVSGMLENAKLRQAIIAVAIIAIPSLLVTGSYIVSDAPVPTEGMEKNPYPDEAMSDGMLFVVLDGGRKDMMSDPELMPNLNRRVQGGAYLEILTNPMTMTAICVKEMATGVPSRPNEALQNFRPTHPGTPDGWNLVSEHEDYQLGILGDYVWKDLYPDRSKVPFSKHRYGHADYYQGDKEAFVTLRSWLEGDTPVGFDNPSNVIIAHLSGLDSVGHRYMAKNSFEYEEKLRWLDRELELMFQLVPDNWTVFVTSDHGLTDTGQHGSPDDIIREVAGFMWGPGVAKGVTVKDVAQRDLATLPSIIFGLDLPWAIHGKIPLDAFELSEEKRTAYNQWNWDAAVARNNWMKAEGHYYVEGLSTDKVEWDKLPEDEMGIRNTDLIISILAVGLVAFVASKFYKTQSQDRKKNQYVIGSLVGIIAVSAFISNNRDWLAVIYYPLGLIGLLAAFYLAYKSVRKREFATDKVMWTLVGVFTFALIFPETRFTILMFPIWLSFVLNKETYAVKERNPSSTSVLLLYPFLLLLIATIFFSDYRVYGVSATRFMVMYTQSYEPDAMVWSVAIAFNLTLIYTARNKDVSLVTGIAISSVMATIPVLVSQDSNSVDWVMISGLIVGVTVSIILKFLKNKYSFIVFQYCAFAWATMSWGAWGGGVSMLMFGCVESFIEKEWSFLKESNSNFNQELSRLILVGIIPIGMWFTWWASLGQTDGILHTRDIDPGNLFLKGGYIGDRLSPSNTWVGFMGAGPVVMIGILWWNLFRREGWDLSIAFYILAIRISMLAIQLSISPNLPRLVFKMGWDIVFGLAIITVVGCYIIYERLRNKTSLQI